MPRSPQGPSYVPARGDLIWLDFSPHAGHEQAGRRPAVVLSAANYNGRPSGLLICVPVTTKIKGYPLEVPIAGGTRPGVALADQVRNLDWRARHADFMGRVTTQELGQIRAIVRALT